ncbi:MAG: AMP-binding protein, partial [Proteobacteria bacterium]|nr:AMP-binding protein [Pseudomonadota bacterium]
IVDGDGAEQPWDGQAVGELLVRGATVASAYYKNPHDSAAFTDDGWFHTGDVASIDQDAVLQITDRTKDLIKSGGEWISSVDLENALMGHASVREAAVIAVPHEKWSERPLAVVVLAEGAGRFRSKVVVAGIESGDRVQILSGLSAGETVVSSGQFLIDSESNIDAELARMERAVDGVPDSEPAE